MTCYFPAYGWNSISQTSKGIESKECWRTKNARKTSLFFIISGVGLSPLGTAVTSGLLYKPQMIDEGDCGAVGGVKIGRGNRICPSATLSTTNPTWPDPGSNPGHRGGKPATNRLSYGMVYHTTLSLLSRKPTETSSWRLDNLHHVNSSKEVPFQNMKKKKKTCKNWNSKLHSTWIALWFLLHTCQTEFSTNYHSSSLSVLFAWNSMEQIKGQVRYCRTIPYFHTTQL
jgi:hypothetical protein